MPALQGGAIYNVATGVVVMFECLIQENSAGVSLRVSDIEMTLDVGAQWVVRPLIETDIRPANYCRRRVVPSTTWEAFEAIARQG